VPQEATNVDYGHSPKAVICPAYDSAASQTNRSDAREVIRRFRELSSDDQQAVIAYLSSPDSYGGNVVTVDRLSTHASLIFLAGDHAFKLKRAVKYPYLDFSTPELRRRACEAELALNRRTAPELYLAVRSINREPDGSLAFDGSGAVLDWVVVMRRFDQSGLFDRLAVDGALTGPLMTELADRIAAFHDAAERMPDGGGSAGIAEVLAINETALARYTPAIFATDKVEPLHAATATFRCMNTASRTTWDVKVDYDRNTADSFPATITAREISWKDTKEGGIYTLDRNTFALTFVNSSSMGGYLLFHTCRAS